MKPKALLILAAVSFSANADVLPVPTCSAYSANPAIVSNQVLYQATLDGVSTVTAALSWSRVISRLGVTGQFVTLDVNGVRATGLKASVGVVPGQPANITLAVSCSASGGAVGTARSTVQGSVTTE